MEFALTHPELVIASRGSGANIRSRAWMGTIWSREDMERIKSYDSKYTIISADDHTTTGQLHWHCLLTFKNPRARPQETETCHWESAKSRVYARKYCLDKGEPLFESGDFTIADQNEHEWKGFVDACKTMTSKELIDSCWSKTYATYRGFAHEVNVTFNLPAILEGELQNEWYWGPPGTGKTSSAWRDNPVLYIKPLSKWWDGYSGEDVVLIDDIGPLQGEWIASFLKIWADRYPFQAEVKGGAKLIRPKKIIVTSNYAIEGIFMNVEDQEAIHRRFKVTHFDRLLERDNT